MKGQNKLTEPNASAGLYCLFGLAGRAPLRSGTLTVQAKFISRAEPQVLEVMDGELLVVEGQQPKRSISDILDLSLSGSSRPSGTATQD